MGASGSKQVTTKLFVSSGNPDQARWGDTSSPPAPKMPLTWGIDNIVVTIDDESCCRATRILPAAFNAGDTTGTWQIWIQPLNALSAHPLCAEMPTFTLRAMGRYRNSPFAVMAAKFTGAAMQRESRVAVPAVGDVATVVALQGGGVATSVEKQQYLVALVEFGDR